MCTSLNRSGGQSGGDAYTGHALATPLATFPLHCLLTAPNQPLPGELREGEGGWSGWQNSGESQGKVQGWLWPT